MVRLAVSNVAWSERSGDKIAAILARDGVSGIEVAPTRIWPDWDGANEAAARAYRTRLGDLGLVVPSMQAVVYGKPELKLFHSSASRQRLLDHLALVFDLGAALGAGPIVLGGPTNRDRGGLGDEEAFAVAVEFFREAGRLAADRGVLLCLEPNPVAYGCNFVTTSEEGARLIKAVDSPGFRLHLDAAAMYLAGEEGPDMIRRHVDILQHFHVSEPHLAAFKKPVVDHAANGDALASCGYGGWISVEMRETTDSEQDVTEASRWVSQAYRSLLQATGGKRE